MTQYTGKCEWCGKPFVNHLWTCYENQCNGVPPHTCICSACYARHLMKYYPHSPLIPHTIEQLKMAGIDTAPLEKEYNALQFQPKLFGVLP